MEAVVVGGMGTPVLLVTKLVMVTGAEPPPVLLGLRVVELPAVEDGTAKVVLVELTKMALLRLAVLVSITEVSLQLTVSVAVTMAETVVSLPVALPVAELVAELEVAELETVVEDSLAPLTTWKGKPYWKTVGSESRVIMIP
jgi:hypothetical protein